MALAINDDLRLGLAPEEVEAAAMLHDIGIFLTNAPGIECRGSEHYIRHGLLGAQILRKEGAPEWAARVAERHTGAGLTSDEIKAENLPLPEINLLPESLLEKLICYADKFFSKSGDMKEKTLESVRRSMLRHGPAANSRFEALHRMFSTPKA